MSLIRTRHGLSNQSLLRNVDFVVYVEGGPGISTAETVQSDELQQSQDVLYWRGIFEAFMPSSRFSVLPRGGKPILRQIAEALMQIQEGRAYVAMDRDRDGFTGSLLESPEVVYTFGYSWENDIWSKERIAEVVSALLPVDLGRELLDEHVGELWARFERDIRWSVYGDVILAGVGDALFPRDKLESLISLEGSSKKPKIRKKQLRRLVREARLRQPRQLALSRSIRVSPLRDCCGHLVSRYSYRVVEHLLRKYARLPKIARQFVEAIATREFLQAIGRQEETEIRSYFAGKLCSGL